MAKRMLEEPALIVSTVGIGYLRLSSLSRRHDSVSRTNTYRSTCAPAICVRCARPLERRAAHACYSGSLRTPVTAACCARLLQRLAAHACYSGLLRAPVTSAL